MTPVSFSLFLYFSLFLLLLLFYVIVYFYKNFIIIIFFFLKIILFFHVPGCSGMFHVPAFIDGLLYHGIFLHKVI